MPKQKKVKDYYCPCGHIVKQGLCGGCGEVPADCADECNYPVTFAVTGSPRNKGEYGEGNRVAGIAPEDSSPTRNGQKKEPSGKKKSKT